MSDFNKNKILSRRILFIGFIKLALILLILLRLIYLQIFKFSKYNTLSNSNRIKHFIIPPLRGKIFDRNNKLLATNTSYYRVLFNPEKNRNIHSTLKKLAEILNINKEDFYYYSKKIKRKSSDGFILVHENLTWEEIAIIEANSPYLPGIHIETAQKRFYPHKENISHIIGYVGSVSENELSKNSNALLAHPDFKIGKNGIEKTFENHLRGKAGLKYVEVDAYGFTIRELLFSSSKKSVAGENLNLTIDIELQNYANELLKNKRGSVILMDITNGEILISASQPSFDPNNFVVGIAPNEWSKLLNNPGKPMTNKFISSTYPPGSTFKPMVALAALSKGLSPKDKMKCSGKTKLGRRLFHCWKKEGHGKVNLISAIMQSCNIYFYNISKEVGITEIIKTAKQFGLGETSDIKIPGEKNGLLPTKKWKRKIFRKPWVTGDTFNTAIGQGFTQATTLQLAVMTARLASRGKKIIPTLTKKQQKFTDIDINKEHIDLVLQGMSAVVNEKKGTAYWQRIGNKKYKMAGKTGTSQIVAIDHSEDEDKEEEILERRNHGLFVGFAPVNNPKFAISVIVEHGGSGSVSAAPIARSILYKAQKKYIS